MLEDLRRLRPGESLANDDENESLGAQAAGGRRRINTDY